MAKNRCYTCQGSGKIMGGGMMLKDCPTCEGIGYFIKEDMDTELSQLDFRTTESYQKAKEKLMKSHSISEEKAVEALDQAFKESDTAAKKKRGKS